MSALLDFKLILVVLLANQRPSIVSPYAPETNVDVRGNPSTLHTPHHVIGVTHVSAYCLYTSAEIHTYDYEYRYQFAPWPQMAVVCRIQNRGMLDLCYDAGSSCGRREAGRNVRVLLVWRGVGCGGWRGSPRASAFVSRGLACVKTGQGMQILYASS